MSRRIIVVVAVCAVYLASSTALSAATPTPYKATDAHDLFEHVTAAASASSSSSDDDDDADDFFSCRESSSSDENEAPATKQPRRRQSLRSRAQNVLSWITKKVGRSIEIVLTKTLLEHSIVMEMPSSSWISNHTFIDGDIDGEELIERARAFQESIRGWNELLTRLNAYIPDTIDDEVEALETVVWDPSDWENEAFLGRYLGVGFITRAWPVLRKPVLGFAGMLLYRTFVEPQMKFVNAVDAAAAAVGRDIIDHQIMLPQFDDAVDMEQRLPRKVLSWIWKKVYPLEHSIMVKIPPALPPLDSIINDNATNEQLIAYKESLLAWAELLAMLRESIVDPYTTLEQVEALETVVWDPSDWENEAFLGKYLGVGFITRGMPMARKPFLSMLAILLYNTYVRPQLRFVAVVEAAIDNEKVMNEE